MSVPSIRLSLQRLLKEGLHTELIIKMVRKGNAVIALAIWLLTVAACVVACAAARLQTSEQTVHPQGGITSVC